MILSLSAKSLLLKLILATALPFTPSHIVADPPSAHPPVGRVCYAGTVGRFVDHRVLVVNWWSCGRGRVVHERNHWVDLRTKYPVRYWFG